MDIGKIVGFIIKINTNFGSSKNNFASKILKNSLKNIAEVHVEKFNKTNFENINFEADGKIKWKKNLIGQFCKGHELSKPLIKVFYDEYFYSSREIIQEKLKNFFLYLMEKKMNFFRKFENINKSSNFLRALEFSILENLGHCRKNSLDTYYNKLTRNEIKLLREAGLKKRVLFFSSSTQRIRKNLDKCSLIFFLILKDKNFMKKIFIFRQFFSV